MEDKQKLVQACSNLGLNLLEISKFVQINEHPKIACWGFDLNKKEPYIYVNPRVLKFPVEEIQLILKHEILHYAGYKNVEHARDYNKANIALDIVINKILTFSNENTMKRLCRKLYPEESKKNILCLARPDVNPDELREHKNLWHSIWSNGQVPSPASIYHQITTPQKMNNPFSVNVVVFIGIAFRHIPNGDGGNRLDKIASNVVEDLVNRIQNNGFSRSKFVQAFKEIFVHKKSFDCNNVGEFIMHLESRQKLEEVSGKIISALDNRSSCQVYPYELSRLGIIYVACGVSDKVPIFWNKTPESRKNKLAIYIDTSPSMEGYQEKEVFLIDRLKSYFPTKVYCFANDVEEISVDEFANGNYKEGYSTSFDAVIEHLLESEFDAGVVFTDGYSDINSRNENRFKQSRKRLFTVYFSTYGDVKSELDELSEQTMTVKAD